MGWTSKAKPTQDYQGKSVLFKTFLFQTICKYAVSAHHAIVSWAVYPGSESQHGLMASVSQLVVPAMTVH